MSKAPLWHDNIISIISLWRALFHWINKRKKVGTWGHTRPPPSWMAISIHPTSILCIITFIFHSYFLEPTSCCTIFFLIIGIDVLVPNSGKLCCSSFPRMCLVPPAWCLLFHMSLLFGRKYTGCPHYCNASGVCIYRESEGGWGWCIHHRPFLFHFSWV